MKKILFILFCSIASIGASAQTGKVSVNAGFLFPSTLNATLGYEYPLSYGNAVEVYGEVGNHWQRSAAGYKGSILVNSYTVRAYGI